MSSLGKTNATFCLTRANSGKTGLPGWCERLCYKRILSAEGKTISANSDRRITQEKVPADPVARIASGVILRHSAIIGSLFHLGARRLTSPPTWHRQSVGVCIRIPPNPQMHARTRANHRRTGYDRATPSPTPAGSGLGRRARVRA